VTRVRLLDQPLPAIPDQPPILPDSPPDTEQALQDLHADDLARLQERMNSLREQLQLDNSTPPNQPSTDAP